MNRGWVASLPDHVPRRVVAAAEALVLGAAHAAAFDPVGMVPLAPMSLAMVSAMLVGATVPRALLVGAAFGAGFAGLLFAWLWASVEPVAWLVVVLVEAGIFGVGAVVVSLVARLPVWPLWAACCWVLVEEARSRWPFEGFPWGRLGTAVLDSPVAGAVPYVSVSGTGFGVALLATTAAWAWHTRRSGLVYAVGPTGAVLAALLVPQVAPYAGQPRGSVRLALLQPGVPGAGTQVVAHHREITRRLSTETRELLASRQGTTLDLVVWPENGTAVDPFRDREARAAIDAALGPSTVPLLLGVVVDGPRTGTSYNRSVMWGGDGPLGDDGTSYTKHHLVPFGEYIPWRGLLEDLSPRFAEIPRDMIPGRAGAPPREVAGAYVATALCFDIADDDVVPEQVRRGADVVVVQTSNALFLGTAQLDQQLAVTRIRALETGRWIAVSSINGVTAVIGPDGRIRDQLQQAQPGVLVADVDLTSGLSPAVRWGLWITRSIVGVALGSLAAALAVTFRVRRRPLRQALGDGRCRT